LSFCTFFFLGGGFSSLYFWLCCFFLYLLNQVLPAKAFTCKSIYLSIYQLCRFCFTFLHYFRLQLTRYFNGYLVAKSDFCKDLAKFSVWCGRVGPFSYLIPDVFSYLSFGHGLARTWKTPGTGMNGLWDDEDNVTQNRSLQHPFGNLLWLTCEWTMLLQLSYQGSTLEPTTYSKHSNSPLRLLRLWLTTYVSG
jgi:hypothetical protein